MRVMVAWLAIAMCCVMGVTSVRAQVRYVDENGQAHWVSSPDEVPDRYRGKAETPSLPGMISEQGTWVLWQGRIVTDKATGRQDWQDWKPVETFNSRGACLDAEQAAQGLAVTKGGRFYQGEDHYRCLSEGKRP